MLEKSAFIQCGSCRGYPNVGISQDIRSNSSICITTQSSACISTQSFLKIQQNSRERICTGVSFQSETFNSIGIETSAHIGFCEFYENFKSSFFPEHLQTASVNAMQNLLEFKQVPCCNNSKVERTSGNMWILLKYSSHLEFY